MPTVAFEPVDGVDVCRVEIEASSGPAFVDTPKEPRTADVYVRIGTSTRRLLAGELLRYRETHRD